MFFNPQKEDAKEVADGIMNTFRVGLFNTKYHPVAGQFELPKTIYKDIYVLGFIVGFTTSCLHGLLKGKKWASNQTKVGDYIFEVYKILGMSKDERDVCIRLMGDKELRDNSDPTGLYDRGASDAQTMFGATYGLLKDSDPDPILRQARELAKNTPNLIGSETPETKLSSAVGQLTIWKHLKQTYGDQLIVDEPSQQTEDSQSDEVTEGVSTETDYKEKRKKWETRLFRNLQLLFDIDIGQIRKDIRETKTRGFNELDRLLLGLWTEDYSSLVSTLTVVDNLHQGSLLKPDVRHFDYDDMIRHYKKCKTVIELNKLDDTQIPFCTGFFEDGDFLLHIDDVIERIEDAKEDDENEKTESEKIIAEVFYYHRIVMGCAENCINDEKRTTRSPHRWTETMFRQAKKLNGYLQKLGKLKGIDYPDALMEVLICEKSFPKVTQQKIYDEIKASGHKGLDENDVVKRLVLKEFVKLK
jgi:hypothetical protein